MKPFTSAWGVFTGHTQMAVTLTAAAGGFFQFGYDQGIANALTQSPSFYIIFPMLTDNEALLGAVLGMLTLGAFFGASLNSAIGNHYGRRPVITLASLLAFLGAALQAGSINLPMIMIARFINGLAVGLLTSAVPTLIGEITKPQHRGMIMAIKQLSTSLRHWVVLVTVVCLPFRMFEAGRAEEGYEVLVRYHGEEYAVQAASEIQDAIAQEHETSVESWFSIFVNNKQRFGRRTWLAVGANLMQQLTGINIATYYAGQIFIDSIQMPAAQASLALGGLGITAVVASVVGSFVLMDGIGRVKTMHIGSFFCSLGMIFLAAGISVATKSGGYLAATGLFLFLFSFCVAWLPVEFIYGAEIVPLATRARAASLGVAVSWLTEYAIVQVTPVATKAIGAKYFIIFATTNAIGIPIQYFLYPETGRLTLEGIDQLFDGTSVILRRGVSTTVEPCSGGENGSVQQEKEQGKAEHFESAA